MSCPAPHVTRPWTGVLLAGGASCRMGTDKALLDWHGQPLMAHMRGLLQAAGARDVLVSGDYPEHGGIADLHPGLGPLGGLYSVTFNLMDVDILVVPIDMPQLNAATLSHLMAQDCPHASYVGQLLPMRMRIDAHSKQMLSNMVIHPEGRRSVFALQQRLGTTHINPPTCNPQEFENCNTPAQWEALLSA